MTIAEILDAERGSLGVSVNELARRAGMSAGRVHGILKGDTPNPGVLTLLKVLGALDRSLTWLEGKLSK